MKRIATDAPIERLTDWGVETGFGLPGDGINWLMESIRRNEVRVRFVLVHHKEAAAFMAAAPWAEACGGLGIRVDKCDELDDAISQALAADEPALVDVTVNPDEPPMPSKVTFDQAKEFARAFLSDQSPQTTIARTLFRDKTTELKA
jgi:thiamine pyrophosphate-dependent acetolactate synthase large subunit-like protein